MRFGWLAAAAALVCAGQTGAQTFTRYQVTGTGMLQPTDTVGAPVGAGTAKDFTFTFSELTSPGTFYQDGYVFTGDGSTFTGTIFTSYYPHPSGDGSASGVLKYNEYAYGPLESYNEGVTVGYADTNSLGGFPITAASSAATGGFSLSDIRFLGGSYGFNGTVNSFSVLGSSGTFQASGYSFTPEPATWLTMILGIALVGYSLRQQKKAMGLA